MEERPGRWELARHAGIHPEGGLFKQREPLVQRHSGTHDTVFQELQGGQCGKRKGGQELLEVRWEKYRGPVMWGLSEQGFDLNERQSHCRLMTQHQLCFKPSLRLLC